MNADLRDDDDGGGSGAFADRFTAYLDELAGRTDVGEQDVAEFGALAGELRAASTWNAPPPVLREAILSRVRVQAKPGPEPAARVSRSRWRSRWGRLIWAIPVAAVTAAAYTIGIVVIDRALQPGLPAGETYVAAGSQLAPGATATVVVSENPSGFSLRIQATGLPAAALGSYYCAWLHGPRGVVPLGSFHQHRSGGSVALWSGVDPKDYTTFVITLQAEGEPPNPSGLVVMTATLKH